MTSALYKPLDNAKQEIRLVEICPIEAQKNISCRLFVVPLDKSPKYKVALLAHFIPANSMFVGATHNISRPYPMYGVILV